MSELPIITVVISTFNGERWLKETLESVFSQTYPKDKTEIIVIDDGSTDSSARLAKNLLANSANPHQVKSTTNQGINRANNLGWSLATGEWVLFLGHDDLLHPEKLNRSFALTAPFESQVAAVYSNWQKYIPSGSGWTFNDKWEETQLPQHDRYSMIRGLVEKHIYIHGSAIFFRKQWLSHVQGFDPDFKSAEDTNLQIRIDLSGGKFIHVPSPTPLSYWRDTPGSWSKKGSYELARGIVHNMTLIEKTLKSEGIWDDRIRNSLAYFYFSSGRFLASKDWKTFVKVARHIQELQPDYLPTEAQMGRRNYWICRTIGYTAFTILGLIWHYLKFKRGILNLKDIR